MQFRLVKRHSIHRVVPAAEALRIPTCYENRAAANGGWRQMKVRDWLSKHFLDRPLDVQLGQYQFVEQ